jgi:hypothetical protein
MDANHLAAALPARPEQTLPVGANLTERQIQSAHRLGHQVYCVENPFENSSDHPDSLEPDDFVSDSVHSLLGHRASGRVMGTTRLIMSVRGPLQRSFAIQQACEHLMLKRLPLHRTAVVSRRRAGRTTEFGSAHELSTPPFGRLRERGSRHHTSVRDERAQLLRLLAAVSIRFDPLSPPEQTSRAAPALSLRSVAPSGEGTAPSLGGSATAACRFEGRYSLRNPHLTHVCPWPRQSA